MAPPGGAPQTAAGGRWQPPLPGRSASTRRSGGQGAQEPGRGGGFRLMPGLGAPTACCIFTASTGNWPLAVSPDSMMQSAPSSTAFATSLVSARVGRGLVIMLSSIWGTSGRQSCGCHTLPGAPPQLLLRHSQSALRARVTVTNCVTLAAPFPRLETPAHSISSHLGGLRIKHWTAECARDLRCLLTPENARGPQGSLQTCVAHTTGLPARLQRPIIIF